MTEFNAEAYRAQLLARFADDLTSTIPSTRRAGAGIMRAFKKMSTETLQRHWELSLTESPASRAYFSPAV